ncbi:MAG: homoserine O-acetyltransferase [Pseudonocardiales bacterium]|nr:homoserine O-acetyltransferase [Pseudonocardiales bacterium]
MPASYWRPGDAVGGRRFVTTGPLNLESGAKLLDAQIAYESWGEFTGDNAVLVEHALTGDSHVSGPTQPGHPTPGWWNDLIGPGRPLDTRRWFVVATNVLGGCQGSTGPSSISPDGAAYGSRFPRLNIRDQVAAEIVLADQLAISRWQAVIGGSMGGMRAAEWAVTQPDRVERLILLACGAQATAEQIALCSTQVHAIESDPDWHDGDYYETQAAPRTGMGIARRIAHISYRSELELAARFGRSPQGDEHPLAGGRYAIESYLDHHADKLARRFDPGSYVNLSRAMNTHDLGRDRGGVAAALARVTAKTTVVSISSDRLYRPSQQEELAAGISGARLRMIESPYGHDGFLIEGAAVGQAVADALEPAVRPT